MKDPERMDPAQEGSRQRVIAEARTWIGTPYHHAADVKGIGVDCGMLLIRVFADCGLIDFFDPRPYAQDWHLHRAEEMYKTFVGERALPVANPLPGDIILFKFGRCVSHGGIVTRIDPLTIIHAFHPAGVVLEEDVACNAMLAERQRDCLFFSHFAARGDR